MVCGGREQGLPATSTEREKGREAQRRGWVGRDRSSTEGKRLREAERHRRQQRHRHSKTESPAESRNLVAEEQETGERKTDQEIKGGETEKRSRTRTGKQN